MSKVNKAPDLTPEERRVLKGAIRRAFRQSPRMRDALNRARVELPPALKKDGTPGKKNQVRFVCAACKDLHPGKFVVVDHIEPVVPLGIKEENMTPNDLVAGIFCPPDNLQVLCSTPIKFFPKGSGFRSCHAKKSDEENFIRRGLSTGGSLKEWAAKYNEDDAERTKVRVEKDLKKKIRLEKKQNRPKI